MSGARTSTSTQSTVLGWLLPPLFLAAIGLGVWLILSSSANYFVWGASLLIGLSLLWVLVSTLFPRGPAERICPACGADTLVRAEADSTSGLVCSSCLWKDDEQSSFLLAEEEEDPIETSVLRRRRKRSDEIVIRSWTGSADPIRRDSPDTPPAPPAQSPPS